MLSWPIWTAATSVTAIVVYWIRYARHHDAVDIDALIKPPHWCVEQRDASGQPIAYMNACDHKKLNRAGDRAWQVQLKGQRMLRKKPKAVRVRLARADNVVDLRARRVR